MKRVKTLSLLLALCMIFSLAMPVSAFADEDTAPVEEPVVEVPAEVSDENPTLDESDEDDSGSAPTLDDPAGTPAEGDASGEPAEDVSADYSLVNETTEDDGIELLDDGTVKMVTIEKLQDKFLDTNTFYRIFHLDCGRKYFSVAQIEALIDVLAAKNYTHIELALGNDGLRFLLDDMSVTANNTTYNSDSVRTGIQAGNNAYHNDSNGNALTQTEMDTIISYANGKGIGVIPLINAPGHMDAILDCMESLGISNPAYSNSARTVDVTNAAAVNFTLALIDKYIQYFAGEGCTIFNMGCDEYANDVSNSGFAGLISSGKYSSFVTFVNNMAAQVQNAGMVAMAFNDGIYYNSYTSGGTFDSNIAISFWTTGWPGYSPASASFLAGKGHKIISTNDAWYYVLGRQTGSYNINTAQNGVQNTACTDIPGNNDPTAAGCMICLWCDTPSASYSSTEVSNVTGLISTFATNNPTYFAVDSGETGGGSGNTGDVEVTQNKIITITVGGTATDTIEGADYSNNIVETELDKSIATVSAEYEQVTGGTEEVKATSITYGSSYYIKNRSGQYLSSSATWVSDISSAALWTATSSGNGYTLKNGNNYLLYWFGSLDTTTKSRNATTWTFSDGTFSYTSWSNTYTLGDAYTVTTTAPVDATTVTFTGVTVGTTYVTVGNTRYKIIVQDKAPDNAITSGTLSIDYRITNSTVYTSQSTTSASSATISSSDAASDEGIAIVSVVPETAYSNYDGWIELHYWQAMRLDSEHKQSGSGSGADQTTEGTTFTHVRYHNSAWQYLTSDGVWHYFQSDDQAVAYYMRHTEITTEITTAMKDWGYSTSSTTPDTSSGQGQVALTVAVVYPDGTVSPAESNMYANSTTIFNFSANWQSSGKARDIGLIVPLNNSDYTISKITVTDGTRTDNTTSNIWTSSATIEWDKVPNEAGSEWYDETTYWDESAGGTPMINGATQDIRWSAKNTAKLVLIYLKPVHYDTNLTVNWVDDSASGALISTMEVAVSSDVTPITFYNGLKQTSALPAEGVGGTFTLDDNAYVTNSSNVNQTFNKNISTVPGVADVYKTGLFYYVSADLSADGMTLTLHYNIDSSKLSKQYVVDFGLPVNIPLSDLIENSGNVSKVEITGGDATVNADNSITYQPSAVLTGTATVGVKLTFNDNTTQTVRIGFVPATTVYYEEGFASYTGSWTNTGSKGSNAQKTEIGGSKTNNYGYDSIYSAVGASNGTQAISSVKGDSAVFTFTGSGVDIYTNNDTSTGRLMVRITDASGSLVKMAQVSTAMQNGLTSATEGQEVNGYNVPVFSVDNLTRGTYTVTLTVLSGDVYLDGFRVYNTLDPNTEAYRKDLEDNPAFIELRDKVFATDKIDTTDALYAGQIARNTMSQIYATGSSTEGGVTAVILDKDTNEFTTDQLKDLLDNGPKNEIYLQPNQALTFKIATAREVQIGLKALNAATSYTINGESKSISTSTDMFYTVLNKGTSGEQTITITNTGSGILAVTKLKVCDDPNFSFAELTEEDLIPALVSLGYELEPEEPVVEYADATLTVEVNGQTTTLTKNGVVGESATFTAAEIEAAAQSLVPDGYELKDQAEDVTVVYGQSATVSLSAEEIPTEPEEPEQPTEPEKPEQPSKPANIISAVIRLIDKIFGSLKGLFR